MKILCSIGVVLVKVFLYNSSQRHLKACTMLKGSMCYDVASKVVLGIIPNQTTLFPSLGMPLVAHIAIIPYFVEFNAAGRLIYAVE